MTPPNVKVKILFLCKLKIADNAIFYLKKFNNSHNPIKSVKTRVLTVGNSIMITLVIQINIHNLVSAA